MPWPQQRGAFRARGRSACGSGQAQLRLALVTVALGAVIRRADGGVAVAPAIAGPGVAAVAAYAPADHDHWAPVAQDHGRRAPRSRRVGAATKRCRAALDKDARLTILARLHH